MPTEDKFRSHYYLMFWQESCFWSPKQWRKVHRRALERARSDFEYKHGTKVEASIEKDAISRSGNSQTGH